MPRFSYQAKDADGKLLTDFIDAVDEGSASTELSNRGLWVVELQEISDKAPLDTEINFFSGVSASDLNSFLIQLSIMIKCGVSLAEALQSLENGEENSAFKKVLFDIRTQVAAGRGFSEALSTHPEVFDKFFLAMIKVGETGGILEEVLKKLASTSKRRIALKNQIIGSLAYPALLFTVAGIVLSVLMFFAVPKFAELFAKANLPLPVTTRILISISQILTQYTWQCVGGTIFTIVFLVILLLTTEGQKLAGEICLRLPVLKQVVQRYFVVQISEPMGLLLGAGVPLRELLLAIENTIEMDTARSVVSNMRESIEHGSSLKQALDGNPIFPNMAIKLVETGEKSGSLDQMFTEIAEYYDDQLQSALKSALSLLEPFLIFFMALLVGFIMLSVFLPLFQMSFIRPK
ncbi:MAG: type II secretion system F family protein [Candidatus Riflebacteria bacterium]|nr:type II secretion system F family protein [Candidatus Riflebacteria bacterium]